MLPPAHRLRTSTDFEAVVRRGTRVGGSHVVVHALAGDPEWPVRIGFVVSKAVGGAVQRNLVRRRLRHVMRDRLSEVSGGLALVVRALPSASTAPFAELDADVGRALERTASRISSRRRRDQDGRRG